MLELMNSKMLYTVSKTLIKLTVKAFSMKYEL